MYLYVVFNNSLQFKMIINTLHILQFTILPKVLGHPFLMKGLNYFSHFHEYKS